jgi:hypothetical protein
MKFRHKKIKNRMDAPNEEDPEIEESEEREDFCLLLPWKSFSGFKGDFDQRVRSKFPKIPRSS